MKKDSNVLWLFPLYFFIFLAIFLSAKFIFIFFFRASYEPDFMFKLTPFHILSGFNNLQLLFLSLIVIISGMYLHLKVTKKNLTYSFIPTAVMLCGLGFSIATEEISISTILNYLLFGCLLIAILIDQKHILLFPEVVSIEKEPQKSVVRPKLAIPRIHVRSSVKRKPRRVSYPTVSPLFSLAKPSKKAPARRTKKEKYVEFKEVKPARSQVERTPKSIEEIIDKKSIERDRPPEKPTSLTNADIQYAESMVEEIERRMKKLTTLGGEIKQKQRDLAEKEKAFGEQSVTSVYESISPESTPIGHQIPSDKKKKDISYRTLLEEFQDPTAVIQRGAFKEVSQPFADLLGYEAGEIVGKRLLDFVVPESFSSTEKYYLHRLKGKSISGIEIMFLTKNDHKIAVELITKPTMFNGEKIEVMIFKKVR